MSKNLDDRLYNLKEILDLDVFPFHSRYTLIRYIKSKKIKGIRIGKGAASRYYVKGSDLREFYNKITKKEDEITPIG